MIQAALGFNFSVFLTTGMITIERVMLLGKKFLITGRVSGCMNGTQPTDTVQRPYELAQFNSLLQSVGVQKIVAAYTTCYLLTDEGDVYAHRPSVCQCCRYSWGSSVWGELGIKNRNQTQNENSTFLSLSSESL